MYKVYKHTCPNGKVYIGITGQSIIRRWNNGRAYMSNEHFTSAIKKYGWKNIVHEVLFDGLSKEDACKKEVELIAQYKSNDRRFGYNKSVGGESPCQGVKFSEESLQKLRLVQGGKNNGMYGKHHTQETRERLREAHKRENLSAETLRKMSESSKGKFHSQATREKMKESNRGERNGMFGKHHKQSTKEKISACISKSVICVDTNTIYKSMREAEKETKVNKDCISKACRGLHLTAGGLHWKYYKKGE